MSPHRKRQLKYEQVNQGHDELDTGAPQSDDEEVEEGEVEDVGGRPSVEVRRFDHETIAAEEEAERLLTGSEEGAISKRSRTKQSSRTTRWNRAENVESELMYKVEEGARSPSSGSSSSSGTTDLQRLKESQVKSKVGLLTRLQSSSRTPLIEERNRKHRDGADSLRPQRLSAAHSLAFCLAPLVPHV